MKDSKRKRKSFIIRQTVVLIRDQFDGRRILIARAISKLCLLQQNFILQQKTNLPHPRGWGKIFSKVENQVSRW